MFFILELGKGILLMKKYFPFLKLSRYFCNVLLDTAGKYSRGVARKTP